MLPITVVYYHMYGVCGNDLHTVTAPYMRTIQAMPGVRIHEVFTWLEHKTGTAVHRGGARLGKPYKMVTERERENKIKPALGLDILQIDFPIL